MCLGEVKEFSKPIREISKESCRICLGVSGRFALGRLKEPLFGVWFDRLRE
jgi:hypothetical protein